MSISAIIYDMDGILLDSEPFWRQAEREIFATVDVHLTEEDCIETMGIRIDEVVSLRYSQKPWKTPGQETVARQIVERVAQLVRLNAQPLPGVHESFAFFREKQLPIGLATSSDPLLIRAVLEALNLENAFDCIHSAQNEKYGKPHPAVYLATAEKMHTAPTECLAIEDSLTGVISAKAARMKVIAIPESAVADDPRFSLADLRLSTLLELAQHWNELTTNRQPK